MNEYQKRVFDGLSGQKEDPITKNRVLIVDGLNTFFRAFSVIGHVNSNLNHIGGLSGFLRSLGYATNAIRPTRIIIAFDGKGSSTNKKYIYSDYKANRGLVRVSNWDVFDNQEEESDSIKSQVVRLLEYLDCLPIDVISIDKIEADDVIAYIAKSFDKNVEVTIMSSDKDYLQLVSDNIVIYSPTKKKFYTSKMVLEEYEVSPENFLMQKMLLGDKGDNVPKINGLGIKTLIKKFPELSSRTQITLDELLEKCIETKDKTDLKILAFEHQLRINQQLMDLHNPNIPDNDKEEINNLLLHSKKTMDVKKFIKLYNEDDLGNSINNPEYWALEKFYYLSKQK